MFKRDGYWRINGQPVLPIWGSDYFKLLSDWNSIFSGFPDQPLALGINADSIFPTGSFSWIHYPQNPDRKHTETVTKYLDGYYHTAKNRGYRTIVGSVYPRYRDYLCQSNPARDKKIIFYYGSKKSEEDCSGKAEDFGSDGNTYFFQEGLNLASQNQPHAVQVATWNDFGEGTTIEPTTAYGNTYLEILQTWTGVQDFEPQDFERALRWFNLRRQFATNSQVQNELDRVFQWFVSGNESQARLLLDQLP